MPIFHATDYWFFGALVILQAGVLIVAYAMRKRQAITVQQRHLKRYENALQVLEHRIRTYPMNAAIYRQKAQILDAMGKRHEAASFYRLAQKLSVEVSASGDYADKSQPQTDVRKPTEFSPL